MKVPELYESLLVADTDVKDHLPTFRQLVVDLDAVRVCELGVRGGVSTVAWLMGLEQTDGRLWGVDVAPAPFTHPRLTFLRGDDCDQAVIDQVPDDLDVLFIDTSHHYIQTQREIELWAPKLGDGGCMVFHDTAVKEFDHHDGDEPPFPVRKAVEEAGFELGWEIDWRENCFGLAVCWPPTEET